MADIEGIIVSVIYIVFSFMICWIIWLNTLNKFICRKTLHFLMSNWWIIRLKYITNYWLILGPLMFVLINSVYSYKWDKKSMGTPLFAVSLSIFTFITAINDKLILPSTMAILVLGYADSGAALAGRKYQEFNNLAYEKSIVGSAVFFFNTIVTVIIVLNVYHVNIYMTKIICFSLVMAFAENKVFPKCDNLIIPIFTFILFYKFY
ncbi:MAG: hypothetical protein Q4C50_10900 [Eubacteriales bacterium]|nr:hypothetical protein [Eubacteriales bacterium]